jgi:hypothetical protein
VARKKGKHEGVVVEDSLEAVEQILGELFLPSFLVLPC